MSQWTATELQLFATTPSLWLSAGPSAHERVELGMVTVDRKLIVRAFQGAASRWFAAAIGNGTGTIEVDGHQFDVVFQRMTGDDDRIEGAYRQSYGAAAGLVGTTSARAATLVIAPQ